MHWTRREFLGTMTAAALDGGRRAAAQAGSQAGHAAVGREPFFPSRLVADFLAAAERRPRHPRPTGLSRDDYLGIIDGVTRFFVAHQDQRGAIIDPYEKKERQYSTPAFALSAAVLCASGKNVDLLPAALRAMESACADLANGKAADRHADFFTVLLLHADIVLRHLVPASASER